MKAVGVDIISSLVTKPGGEEDLPVLQQVVIKVWMKQLMHKDCEMWLAHKKDELNC